MSAWTYRQSDGKAASKIVPPRLRIPCWKGLGADSEEKREPASDIDTAVVDGLKVLDPNGRLEKLPRRLIAVEAEIDPQRTSDWQKARRRNNSLNYALHLKARGGVQNGFPRWPRRPSQHTPSFV